MQKFAETIANMSNRGRPSMPAKPAGSAKLGEPKARRTPDRGLSRYGVPTESPTVQSERKGFVPCDHEYLNFKGTKLSKSRGAFVEVPYFLSKYDPDPLRYYLTATAPETCDTEFSW
jgi:hypothetical protein